MRVSHPRRFYVPLPQCLKIFQKSRIQHGDWCGQTVLPDRSILIGQKLVDDF